MKSNFINFAVATTSILIYSFSFCQEHEKTISYRDLKKVYENYDTTFLSQINTSDPSFLLKKGNRSLGYLDELNIMMDWPLNHRSDGVMEYSYQIVDETFILEVLCVASCLEELRYEFKITGDKPRIIFKKGKRNWYKIKELIDMELVSKKWVAPIPLT